MVEWQLLNGFHDGAVISPGDLITRRELYTCHLWREYARLDNGQFKMIHPHSEELEAGRQALVISIIKGSKQIPIVALLVSSPTGADVFRFTWQHMLEPAVLPVQPPSRT